MLLWLDSATSAMCPPAQLLWECPEVHHVAALAGHASTDQCGCLGRRWQCCVANPELTVVCSPSAVGREPISSAGGVEPRLAHLRLPCQTNTPNRCRRGEPQVWRLSPTSDALRCRWPAQWAGRRSPNPVHHRTLLRES